MIKVPKWVAPRLVCGLGNRLFQMSAAISLAERLHTEVVFFLPRMSTEHGDFSLIFKLFPSIRLIETVNTWIDVKEGDALPDTDLPIVLHGFFQNSKSFPSLTLPILPERLPSEKGWAIHFRLGDYCILPHHQVDLRGYYYQTITKNIPSNTRLLLFSDSPERLPAISEELRNLGYFPEIFNDKDVLKTLRAFSACQGGSVCSNSTFSWWAAFFSHQINPSYRAFFPNIWMKNESAKEVFTLPFTIPVDISLYSAPPFLKSFSYY